MVAREGIAVQAEDAGLAVVLLPAALDVGVEVDGVEERAVVEQPHAPVPAVLQIEVQKIEVRE